MLLAMLLSVSRFMPSYRQDTGSHGVSLANPVGQHLLPSHLYTPSESDVMIFQKYDTESYFNSLKTCTDINYTMLGLVTLTSAMILYTFYKYYCAQLSKSAVGAVSMAPTTTGTAATENISGTGTTGTK